MGSKNKALASETRIRQPPEKSLVARFCIAVEKPRPANIRRARGSAESAPIALSSSYTYGNMLKITFQIKYIIYILQMGYMSLSANILLWVRYSYKE